MLRLLMLALLTAVAAAIFHKPHVVDLTGSSFEEKVSSDSVPACRPLARQHLLAVHKEPVFQSFPRMILGIAHQLMLAFTQVTDGGVWFIKFYAPWCGALRLRRRRPGRGSVLRQRLGHIGCESSQ